MMWRENRLFRRTIFVSGPPRSGTKLAAQTLNSHPQIWTAIDDHVFECWALYYYRTREGLVERLRRQGIGQREARKILAIHLVRRRRLVGIAPSPKAAPYPRAELPARPDSAAVPLDSRLLRYQVPLNRLGRGHCLCLKSPEISFVLPQMAKIFPRAKFVLVYRPLLETAESMYRRGHAVRDFPVYHRRWREETDEKGEPVTPPGVPLKWSGLWRSASDFSRCIIYAASYWEAMLDGLSEIPPARRFVYSHADLRAAPKIVLQGLARFLEVNPKGFDDAILKVRSNPPVITSSLREEFDVLAAQLKLGLLSTRVELFDFLKQNEAAMESR